MGLLDFIFGKKLFGRTTVSRETEDKIKSDWEKIATLIRAGGPSNLKQALITADRSFDNALKDVMAGETMGERLKNARVKYDKDLYNKIWSAHKMRNSMVHEAGFEPHYFAIIEAIQVLRSAINGLGVSI